ncbi:MAG: hypothetical protein SFY56_06820 [Bacteroidota bacterium]|nr:hypothetical protein [Bacteroidota bacterium]
MTKFFLKNKVSRPISFTLLLLFITEIIFPTASMALTSGPSQPEVQSFEPISTSDMVDVFSGDFKYNIPLMDVEGYPINMSYASGISTDQEASWVGLGWNLNVGSVNRSMRGIPDDFKGDVIKKESNMKPNRSYGINASVDFELFGKESNKPSGHKKGNAFKLNNPATVGIGLDYNNYTGFGVSLNVGIGISAGVGGKGKLDAGLGLHSSAKDGLDISPNLSFGSRVAKEDDNDKSLSNVTSSSIKSSGTFNTRAGLKSLSFSANKTRSVEKTVTSVNVNPYAAFNGGNVLNITKSVSTIASKGRNAAGSINFGLQSYVPNYSMPMISNNVALSVKFGASIFGADANVTLGGYFASQKLAETSKDIQSYGYMYSEFGQNNEDAMMDFNREKDGSFSRTTKNLPLTNFTYDVYNVTGHGIGGAYRPFRSDVGHVFDNTSGSRSDSYSLGAELGGGNLFKAGVNISVVDVKSTSGKWKDDNEALDYFKFKGNTPNNDYEPYYFKQVGEMGSNPTNVQLYNSLKGQDAYGVLIQQGGTNTANNLNSNLPYIKSKKNIERYNYDPTSIVLNPANNSLAARQKRNQPFVTLNTKEAKSFGLQKDLYSTTGVTNIDNVNPMKVNASAPDHHIAEISVINSDGSRYYYGLPTYNLKSKEVSFTIAEPNDLASGLVQYNATDASKDNTRGIDNVFNMTETPAYAYSHLLTAVVSADYVDLNNNGPDDQDNGTYTKFHYAKSIGPSRSGFPPDEIFKWRMPVSHCANYANYNENSKSNVNDNSANYTYGEKEIWYLDEVETKNYIAKFVLSERKDSYGALEDGTRDATGPRSKKIDQIILYSKPEYKANGSNAIPIKTVNFEYSYELCKNANSCGSSGGTTAQLANNSGNQTKVGNETETIVNAGGKLTLKRVYFTYGKSTRARFNQYQFTYDIAHNYNYHNKAYDRWGNYKPVGSNIDYSYGAPVTNAEFPYSEQDKSNADNYAAAWSLSKIALPSGGEINIEYEADDYAFVQNMPAAQMFNVIGATSSVPTAGGSYANSLFSGTAFTGYTNSNYLVIDLKTSPTSPIDSTYEFLRYYLKDINDGNKQLYFKFLVNLTDNATPTIDHKSNFYEYVSGYADIEVDNDTKLPIADLIKTSGGALTGKAWIKIKGVKIKRSGTSPTINPIALAAAQFGRINYGSVVWDGAGFAPPEDVEEALKQMAVSAKGALKTLVTGFKNPNKAILDKGYCSTFIPAKSMVRLYTPFGKKLGGGSRVKELSIKDNWDVMTAVGANPGQDYSTYGQEYSYAAMDEYGREISSGVASYEPMIGSEENSLKQPFYLGKNKWAVLAPDDRYYVEGPFGESFYPSPNVGYSKVKVKSIIPPNAPNVAKNGYKVYEFYTAKDYPTICKHTPIMPKQYRSPLKTLIKISSKDLVSASQGYVIITNDMHGKPKAELDYAQGKSTPEKETRFYYKSKNGYQEPGQRGISSDASYAANELDNNCVVINKNGIASSAVIGMDFDAVADFRESQTETNMVSSQNNASTFIVGLIPAVVPTIWPSTQYELSRFRSSVLTKVVNKYGILEKTTIRIDKSTTTSESLAYDEETGQSIITKTLNDFNDPIYNVKYPAHWGYNLMGGAYSTVGMSFNFSGFVNGLTIGGGITNIGDYLSLGDELALITSSTNQRAWVCDRIGSQQISIIDQNGNPINITGAVTVKVLRSAKRNLLTSNMQALTCLNNPLPATLPGALNISASSKILEATGTLFSDQWQLPIGNSQSDNCACILPQTTLDLISLIKNLFNTKNNGIDLFNGSNLSTLYPSCTLPVPNTSYYTNAFLNGGIVTPVLNSSQVNLNYNTSNATYLYRHSGYNSSLGVGFDCYAYKFLSAGFNSPNLSPDYNNYGLTENLLNYFPYIPVCNWNVGGVNHMSRVLWIGPGYTGSSPFNSANQLVGLLGDECYGQYENSCVIILDFGPTPVNWTPTLRGYFEGLAQSENANVVDLVPNVNQSSCQGSEVACDFVIKNAGGTILYSAPIKIKSPCLSGALTSECSQGGIPYVKCGKLVDDKVNPYFEGIKGNWRSKSAYSYLTDRVQNVSSAANGLNTDTRNDGYFTTYASLYSPAGSNLDWTFSTGSSAGNNKWVNTVETTKYNQFGTEIETKDALGRYSSALYGYNESYPIATAANAQLQEIAFDGFEDYQFYPSVCKKEHHFDFYSNLANLSANTAHTGKYSINVPAGQTLSQTKQVVANTPFVFSSTPSCAYTLKPFDFIYPFTPYSGTDYVMSYWVKENYTGNKPLDYTTNQVTVTQGSTGGAFVTKNLKRSAIIDGWQRVEYVYTIPSVYAGPIAVNLKSTGANAVYFDDIRMHPVKSSIKTYVYHPVTLKYVAELDANNFATFYEYDDQGNLIRVKKETERGIMTIKESKTHYYKP